MHFKDITTDIETIYTLTENERYVFFLFNRSGNITFNLIHKNAEAYIFAFFIGKGEEKYTLTITQNHSATHSISHTLIKSVVSDTSSCTYDGTIFIENKAINSDASQESRALLLSSDASVSMKPTLEILADDVKCSHKATASPLNSEAIFFAESRGISLPKAEKLLIDGFLNDAFEKMSILSVDEKILSALRNKIVSHL